MLKFWRKIRRKLIDTANLKKYLVYTFGEILLVMVGILLALQVNNWNEGRKQNLKEIDILKNIISDLRQDSITLTKVKPRIELNNTVYRQIFKEQQTQVPFDSTVVYGNLTRQIKELFFVKENHQKLVEEISNERIRQAIVDYFHYEKNTIVAFDDFNLLVIDDFRTYLGNNGVMNLAGVIEKDFYNQPTWDYSKLIKYEKLRRLYGADRFDYLIFELYMRLNYANLTTDRLMDRNRELIEVLERYIE